jgi:hypothetical protein
MTQLGLFQKRCPDCGRPIWLTSVRCIRCTNKERARVARERRLCPVCRKRLMSEPTYPCCWHCRQEAVRAQSDAVRAAMLTAAHARQRELNPQYGTGVWRTRTVSLCECGARKSPYAQGCQACAHEADRDYAGPGCSRCDGVLSVRNKSGVCRKCQRNAGRLATSHAYHDVA